ncbi:hypothetical protein ACPCAG_10580 [Streptomyces pseudogriseolus]|uniref:hypothetical protein n=1 Tax=Streptomyces pseudogriseolus TaxID=36817 RepID=UPI003FA2D692
MWLMASRWVSFFQRHGAEVTIRLVVADDDRAPDGAGTLLWSGRHTLAQLARSAVRAFDQIAYELGDEAYAAQWGRPFPRTELEALRNAMRMRNKQRPYTGG